MAIKKDSDHPETIANKDLITLGMGPFNGKSPL
jgi:hypothetical protein